MKEVWIANEVILQGSEHQVMEVLRYIQDDYLGIGSIDFNKIVPIPKTLYVRDVGLDEAIDVKEWKQKHWGTCSNANNEHAFLSDFTQFVLFKTLNEPVLQLVQHLSRLFPEVLFMYYHTSFTFGEKVGEYVISAGQFTENQLDSVGLKRNSSELTLSGKFITSEDESYK